MRSCALLFVVLLGATKARADEPISVWYRSSEGCPDAGTFLSKLKERAASAQLAQVGDHIDFVVTLGTSAEGASGQLERQTERGTVAIRELRGARCESVAEALALTLALTVDAGSPIEKAAQAPSAPLTPATNPSASPEVPRNSPPAAARKRESPLQVAAESSERPLRVGLGALGTTLVEGQPLFEGAAFIQLQRRARSLFGRRAFRFTVHGGVAPEVVKNVDIWLMAGRWDASPFALGGDAVQLRPAVALDVGFISAKNTVTAERTGGFWWALSALARLDFQLAARWALEAEAGLFLPMTRYELWGSGERRLGRVDPAGLSAGLGMTFALP